MIGSGDRVGIVGIHLIFGDIIHIIGMRTTAGWFMTIGIISMIIIIITLIAVIVLVLSRHLVMQRCVRMSLDTIMQLCIQNAVSRSVMLRTLMCAMLVTCNLNAVHAMQVR